MPTRSTFPMPLRVLLALVALVLVAHSVLLTGYTTALGAAAGPSAVLNTRQIDAAPAAAAPGTVPAPAAPSPTPTAPRKKPTPAAQVKPNPPVAKADIAQAAPETIAIAQAVAADPAASPAATPAATPPAAAADEAAPLASTLSAQSGTVAQAPTDSPAAATPTSRTATEAALRATEPAQRTPLALQFPASGRLSYNAIQVSGGQPKAGSGTLDWTTDGSEYQLRLESSALFITLLTQTSVGKLGPAGLLPERFSDKRFNRSEKAAHFQREAGKITFSGKQSSAPLQAGAQDRLSMLMQLAAMAAGGAAQLAQAGQVALQVVNTEEADSWLFLVQESEKTLVPAGESMALHLVRKPRKEFDSRLELWLAPSLGYLPVRILQTEANGNTFELQLRSPALR